MAPERSKFGREAKAVAEVTGPVGKQRPRRHPPYPDYKESGVQWLGKVPAHWEVNRLRATVTGCQNGVWGEEVFVYGVIRQ